MRKTFLPTLIVILTASVAAQTTVTLNDTTFDITSGSAIQSGVVSGSGNLIKTGAGTVEFTGINAYTGSTDVQEGTLSFTRDSFEFAEAPWLH